jgi:hypothetical protein
MSDIFSQIDKLVIELNQIAPPPMKAQGLQLPPDSIGKWFVAHVGSGFYALRARFTLPNGTTVDGEPVRELIGLPQSLLAALEFSVNLAKAHVYEWRRVASR